jgi:uncharacterized membrane protein YphA (DoxX/SURF4 family)
MEKTNNKTEKRNKIIYWIATIWFSFGILSGGIAQLIKVQQTVDGVMHLGYPAYLLTIIGIWKILGVIAVLIPKFPLLKEWAYAGFVFLMTGAFFSHLALGDAAVEFFGPLLLLVLILLSWYFRPAERKIHFVTT